MSEKKQEIRLSINVEPEGGEHELEQVTRQLREDLLELDVEKVDLPGVGKAPDGAKAVDPVTWGTLLVTLVASGGVLTTLIKAIQLWLTRQERHNICLEIDGDKLEIEGTSSEEKERLIKEWISRHAEGKK